MSDLLPRRVVACLTAFVAFALLATAATAALDRRPPTKPGSLRVTAKTLTSVSMAWNASTDNSGSFTYRVRLWGDPTVVTLPRTETSYTWTGLRPGVQYYFWVEAVDGSDNKATSDLLVVETLRDTTPPSTPGNVTVVDVTASQVSLSWDASTDDSGLVDLYQVHVSPVAGNVVLTGATSATVTGLAPSTTYAFTVRARDAGWNFSAPSVAVTATTGVSTDVTPPSAPTNLTVSDMSSCEIVVRWTQSTDDQDPQSAIRYRLFSSGRPDPNFAHVIGVGRWTSYGFAGSNTFLLYAVDSAGNVSAPSNAVTLNLMGDDCQ